MTNKLKPCPFCGNTEDDASLGQGSSESMFLSEQHIMYHVECECDAKGEPCETWEGAINAWNTRPIEDALEAENKRLKDALWKISSITVQSGSPEDLIAVSFLKGIASQALNGDENE